MNEYSWKNVSEVVQFEAKKGTNALLENGIASLKDRVTRQVRENTGIHGSMPQRLSTWIHQLCLQAISGTMPNFLKDNKLQSPIDMKSLSPVNMKAPSP